MRDHDLSVVIPAYREEANLRFILPRLDTTLKKMGCRAEILVVDTMEAMDGSEALCLENGARYIHREGGNEYGCAIRTGIAKAIGEWIVFMDADGSHPPEFIAELYSRREGQDVVVASRYVKGGSTDNKPILIIMSRIVNLTYSIVLGLHCRDISNSFKLYRRKDLSPLHLSSGNFDIIEEILYKLKLAKGRLRIVEVPFRFQEREFGETKRDLGAFILSYIKTLIQLRFGK
jgi:dolichol-phosphate mannosyltransferase